MKLLLTLLACFLGLGLAAQVNPGILTGNVMDEKSKALENATVELVRLGDTTLKNTLVTDRNGNFQFNRIAFGFYQLRISHLGFQNLVLDSIYFRTERFDFNLTDIQLKTAGAESKMDEVLIYLEKPLVQSKEGNITFNAGESALSAGSNASELLTNVPLVTKDPNGKLLVRGKEPRILIDDKPVELNLQQLQDLLESMPGSSVEKIEVMTNPPPQYANEQGGVINIVTRKGSVGMNGRVSIYAGSRGEGGLNAGFNYRKQGLALNINAGGAINEFDGDGYSRRQNLDPKRFYNTDSRYSNRNLRPNFRMNLNYDLNKFHTLNLALQYNGNSFSNRNWVNYMNLDGQQQIFHLRDRAIRSTGDNFNPNLSLSYTMKTKKPGESIRLISNLNYSSSFLARDFGELYYNPDYTLNRDSTQQQVTDNKTSGYSLRLEYNRPLTKKTSLSLGAYRTLTRSDIEVDAAYLRKSDGSWAELDALTNHFRFRQTVSNLRGSLKQMFGENLSLSAGLNAEETNIHFDLLKTASDTGNRYWSVLPFANLNRNWKDKLNLSFSYRRTIRRPGINELNPTIDFSDAYTIRFGNPGLIASLAHNFDLVLGKTNKSFYANLGMGYNLVEDIFSQVRTLQPDGKTEVTWQNISGRKEYELSTWSGYTVSKQLRFNLSASYTYNTYNAFDKTVRKFRNGGSLNSNFNTNYVWKELYTATGSFTFNRFANPQGTVRSTVSMNIGLQAKMLRKKLTATLNLIDPFFQQQNRTYTYGPDFVLESYSSTQTRNFRLTLGYSLNKSNKKKKAVLPPALKKATG